MQTLNQNPKTIKWTFWFILATLTFKPKKQTTL
jgi:hypothetical protein